MIFQPLERWFCDACGETISSSDEGRVVWHHHDFSDGHEFKIIHQGRCDDGRSLFSGAVEDFLGTEGLTRLLAFLNGPASERRKGQPDIPVEDLASFVDLVRRLQTPFYEDARRIFPAEEVQEWFSDSNERISMILHRQGFRFKKSS